MEGRFWIHHSRHDTVRVCVILVLICCRRYYNDIAVCMQRALACTVQGDYDSSVWAPAHDGGDEETLGQPGISKRTAVPVLILLFTNNYTVFNIILHHTAGDDDNHEPKKKYSGHPVSLMSLLDMAASFKSFVYSVGKRFPNPLWN